LNEIDGKNRQEESGFKETGQVKESSRQRQDEEVNRSYKSVTEGLNQKNNFKTRASAK